MENLRESLSRFLDKMKEVGYRQLSIDTAAAAVNSLILVHPDGQESSFDPGISAKYIGDLEHMLEGDALGNWAMSKNAWFIRKFIDFLSSGNIDATHYTKPRLPLEEGFSHIIQRYVDTVAINEQQKKSRAWAPKRYAFWLSNHGIHSFSDTTVSDLRLFLMEDCQNLQSKTIPNFRSELRRFHVWLHDHGFTSGTYEELFDFRVAIENKIHPAISPDDVAKILEQIDRSTAIGKRDYAMLLCGIILGLRGCDIVRLKRVDIDWQKGEIRISQHKTGKPLALPLTKDIADAIKDYLLHGRPESAEPNVFLRHLVPIGILKSGSVLSGVFERYKKKAGLDFDGSYYSVRRALGKNLIVAGMPVTTVAQVLGHSDLSSAKQYIDLDSDHLKICALGFEGIRPKGWLL